jgi:predicted small lipoprotein YifL
MTGFIAMTACGQSGPLVLPSELPAAEQPAAEPDPDEDTRDDER